ncbi:ribosome silencing factor [Celeribacter sp.]|uniref:ribosome silencing factor n=1 Tax=Celeribacter sp. TaxID=1890673 RepID=UPI003A9209DE
MSSDTSTKFGGQQMLDFVTTNLDQEKAEDIVTVDLRGKSQIADFMVICSGRSTRQVGALAEKMSDLLKQQHGVLTRIEGKGQGDWVLMDAGDVVVHIFRPEVREFYQLEKMWLPGEEATTKATKS